MSVLSEQLRQRAAFLREALPSSLGFVDDRVINVSSAEAIATLLDQAEALLAQRTQERDEARLQRDCSLQRESALKVAHEGQRQQWREAALSERRRAEAAEGERDRLQAACRSLVNEVRGTLALAELVLREEVGQTNINCLKRRADEVEAVLRAPAAPPQEP